MIKYFYTVLILIALPILLNGQTEVGLVTYLAFDDCTADESRGDPSIISVINGQPTCECGVKGRALRLNGLNDHIFIAGPVNGEFDTEDFTVSFYFKALGNSGVQTIFSKSGEDCSSQSNFAVRYDPNPNARNLNVQMVENSNKSASISKFKTPIQNCWNHVVVVRRNTKTILYLNGELATEVGASSRVNIRNDGILTIGKSYCTATDRFFNGLIDELRVYSRALSNDEIAELYIAPDRILTNDSRLFRGEGLGVDIGQTCSSSFLWTPSDGVSDDTDPNATLSPTETTTYTLFFEGDDGICNASDTIRILVIDPSTLGCEQVFMPSAFTPNDDNLNDFYGISNPEIFAFGGADLEAFEIYDRWGNLVFQTAEARDTWNGFYRNEPVNPGVMLYKVRYTCAGEEKVEVGSLTIIR